VESWQALSSAASRSTSSQFAAPAHRHGGAQAAFDDVVLVIDRQLGHHQRQLGLSGQTGRPDLRRLGRTRAVAALEKEQQDVQVDREQRQHSGRQNVGPEQELLQEIGHRQCLRFEAER